MPERLTTPRRITRLGRRLEDVSWAPDGRRFACSCYHQTGRIAVALLDADGTNLRILTQDPVERAPSWSPDGQRLVFVHVTQSGTDGELDIWQMNADGSGRKRLVDLPGKTFDNFPSWSPDGKRLVFTTTVDKTQEIYLADADGTNLKRLTADPSLKQYPRWSPDGTRILFNGNREGSFDIWSVGVDGKDLRRLTDHPAMDVAPAWSPDGKRIAFVTLRDENPEVYVMNADGSEPRNVSNHPGYDFSPAWKDSRTLTWVSDRDGRMDLYELTV